MILLRVEDESWIFDPFFRTTQIFEKMDAVQCKLAYGSNPAIYFLKDIRQNPSRTWDYIFESSSQYELILNVDFQIDIFIFLDCLEPIGKVTIDCPGDFVKSLKRILK